MKHRFAIVRARFSALLLAVFAGVALVLSAGLADNVKAWALKPDGTYAKVQPPEGVPQVRSQMLFEALARKDYRDTALADR